MSMEDSVECSGLLMQAVQILDPTFMNARPYLSFEIYRFSVIQLRPSVLVPCKDQAADAVNSCGPACMSSQVLANQMCMQCACT